MTRYEISNPKVMPREKAQTWGIHSLSDTELLALLIGSGCKDYPVLQVAEAARNALDEAEIHQRGTSLKGVEQTDDLRRSALEQVIGLGKTKTLQLSAALEWGRRRYFMGENPVRTPADIWELLRHMGDRRQERFLVVCLDGAHHVTQLVTVSVGLLNRSLVHPREVFAPAIESRAAAIAVAHNHPSGNLEPSKEDLDVTRRLSDAGELLGIPLLDHIVFSSNGYTSIREQGGFQAK